MALQWKRATRDSGFWGYDWYAEDLDAQGQGRVLMLVKQDPRRDFPEGFWAAEAMDVGHGHTHTFSLSIPFTTDLQEAKRLVEKASREFPRRGKVMNKNPEDDVPLTFTGDVNAFEYGGGILYYQPEYNEFLWVFWDGPDDDDEDALEDYIYRVYMFRFGPDEDLLADSLSWAEKDIGSIADYVGTPKIELRRMARGTFFEKLRVAEDVRSYWGADNLDSYPYEATLKEMEKRYGKDLNKVAKFGAPKAEAAYEQARRRSGNPTRKLKNKLLK